MRRQYFLLGLASIAGLASAQTIEFTTVGITTFGNIKYYLTNCENSNTGEKTNEFWTYLRPSNTDYRSPDNKYYADRSGNLWWEGNKNLYVTDNSLGTNDQMQVRPRH